MTRPIANANDLKQAAEVLAEADPQLARRLSRLSEAIEQQQLVYATPARETPDGTAYTLSSDPTPQGDYEILYRSPVRQLLSDALVAWTSGEISEGRACELLAVDRQALRAARMQALSRVVGPINEEEVLQRRTGALEALNTYVDQDLEASDDPEYSAEDIALLRDFWAHLCGEYEFLALFEAWRALCQPAQIPHA